MLSEPVLVLQTRTQVSSSQVLLVGWVCSRPVRLAPATCAVLTDFRVEDVIAKWVEICWPGAVEPVRAAINVDQRNELIGDSPVHGITKQC